jgi:two-component system, cell cycle response regulator
MAAILIVEPPSQLRDDLETALRNSGHRVLVVGDGEEALAAWRAERHELVIADDLAARLNGVALAARMKSETPLGFMPIILTTLRNEPHQRAQLLAAADDVLVRPYAVVEMVARANALLRTRIIVDELRAARADSEARTYSDAVTGLRNRAFLGERLAEEWKRAVRYNEPLSLVVMAVDEFRALTDAKGAGFGERVLQSVAAAALRSLRQIDIVTRYGPSEIAALLPNTHVAGALICAERLRRESSLSTIDDVRPTISMGLAFYPGKEVAEATDLMRTAAKALERAREEGPGSICLVQHQGYLFQPK